MPLWPEEYEAFRPEALAAAASAYGAMAADGDDQPELSAYEAVEAARAGAGSLFPERASDATTRNLGGVPCRVLTAASRPVGVYLHFHGGGMAIGSPELNDAENLVLARDHGLTVVSVDYRLAPEHPYPAAIDDGLAVARWLVEHAASDFGTDRLLIGGESSGAYLAAMVLLRVRDDVGRIDCFRAANLVFGVFDWGRSPSQRGLRPVAGPDWLTPERQAQFGDLYLPGRSEDERRDPAVSPAFADLTNLPPALFTIGTLDHLFDDSVMMWSRWCVAGNEAGLAVYPDCGHGFQWFTDTELSRRAMARIHAFLRAATSD